MGIIAQFPNVEIITGEVTDMSGAGDEARITIDGKEYSASYIFNSILFNPPKPRPHQPYLLQHFRGWFIQTERAVFDPGAATLMDFRVPQEHGASFVYVMPLTPDRALVEFTVFSEQLLGNEEYEEHIRHYIEEQIRSTLFHYRKRRRRDPHDQYAFPRNRWQDHLYRNGRWTNKAQQWLHFSVHPAAVHSTG